MIANADYWVARLLSGMLVAVGIGGAFSGCEKKPSQFTPAISDVPPFVDAAEAAGLVFRHHNGMTGHFYMPEMVGAGVALIDYNNDGKLDVFLLQGGPFGPEVASDAERAHHVLFRNDLEILPSGERRLRFTDVSESAGVNFSDYPMGVAAADFDNDGWCDLYLACFGRNRLLRNQGNGSFADVTDTAGVGCDGWSTSASWTDYDLDGKLDLFVCQYLEWNFASHQVCHAISGRRDYCGPKTFPPARSRLYHNVGGGRFEDVSLAAGIQASAGAALGVVGADLNGDGKPDFFVANDGMPNFLWINQGNGSFREQAVQLGCAFNMNGQSEANMGVIAADFTADGLDDLFITHLNGEKNTFYRNLGVGGFVDESAMCGLDAPSRPFTGFGTGAIDYDNDGFLDIFCVNGEVRIIEEQARRGVEFPMQQRCQLFRNLGGAQLRFEEFRHGEALDLEDVGRGAAFGDLDNDGDLDIVVTNNNGPVRLLVNQVGQLKHWIGLRLVEGEPSLRKDVLGATATRVVDGALTMYRRSATDGSYCSSSDSRILFGLNDLMTVSTIRVQWPDGFVEQWQGLAADQYHELARGSGTKQSSKTPVEHVPRRKQ